MEVVPWKQVRKQAKAQLAIPTASFKGKTVLITGANGDFGAAASQIIAEHDVDNLILACRTVAKGEALKAKIEEKIKAETKPNIMVWALDLESFDSVREFAKRAATLESLGAVVLNAAMFNLKKVISPEGWEKTIQVNHIATALLALLLLPSMRSSPSNPSPPIMTLVGSWSIYPAHLTIKRPRASPPSSSPKTTSKAKNSTATATTTTGPAPTPFLKSVSAKFDSGNEQPQQYGRSKFLIMHFIKELAARVPSSRVVINEQDPGTAWTPITEPTRGSAVSRFFMRMTSRPIDVCARTLPFAISRGVESHGVLMIDYDVGKWPKFMTSPKGVKLQLQIWDETKTVLEEHAPEVADVYASLLGGDAAEKNGAEQGVEK